MELTESGGFPTLWQPAAEISRRFTHISFQKAEAKWRVSGGVPTLRDDPSWRNNPLLSKYFQGHNGASIGARYQTEWSDLFA